MDVWYDGSHAMTFYAYTNDEYNPLNGQVLGHTWSDFGLVPTSCPYVVPPERKKYTVDIPGTNGIFDVSELFTGYPLFNNREGSWSFYITDSGNADDEKYNYYPILDDDSNKILDNKGNPILSSHPKKAQNWANRYMELLNTLHGRNVAIIFDDDPDYYWHGYIHITEWVNANDNSINGVTINYSLYPYKLEKKLRVLDIDMANIAVGEKFDIPCGKRPVILSCKNDFQNLDLIFENEELGININIYDVASDGKWRELSGQEVSDPNVTNVSAIVSNVSGSNICNISTAHEPYSTIETPKFYLRYRVGEL